ncbi:MAG: carotenoid biosynthesis protein [Haloarculaceae archaeon]
MDPLRRYQVTNIALFLVAVLHAFLTWNRRSALVLFLGGIAITFGLEAVGIAAGLLEHELRPQILGVPVSVVLVWPSIVYGAYRIALLVAPSGVEAALVAAVLATGLDVLTDPNGVRDGVWRYPETAIPGPRFRGVPWWNFVGWLVIVFATAMLPTVV